MKKQTWELINAVATGFIVLVLFLLVLFWCRLLCNNHLIKEMPEQARQITIKPSGLIPGEPTAQKTGPRSRSTSEQPGPNEPNVLFSQIYAQTYWDSILFSAVGRPLLNIISEVMPYRDANERVYYWYRDKDNYICFDKHTGLIRRRYTPDRNEPNDENMSFSNELFAGPNGISRTVSASLGRFYDLSISGGWGPNWIGIYDGTSRQFYVIDFVEGTVNKESKLTEINRRGMVATGKIEKGFYTAIVPQVIWSPPEIWNAAEGGWRRQRVFLAGEDFSSTEYYVRGWSITRPFVQILDKTGRIYNYNTKEQSLVQAGFLPMPWSMFKSEVQNDIAKPRNVLAYNVLPVYATLKTPFDLNKPPEGSDVRYLGMSVACVSREGTAMALAVFDPNGRMVCRGDTMCEGMPSVEAVYSQSPEAPIWTMAEFLLENLQPTVFGMAAYLCGDCISATAGHRALFILPNSFIGMLGRAVANTFLEKQVLALLLICPSLVLSVWLAGRIRKDAKLTGLSNSSVKGWMAGTMAFGLPAYITYRMTRHKEVLVTCQNCGMMRRPDMEKCHRCGSKWDMPELTPPNWRICD